MTPITATTFLAATEMFADLCAAIADHQWALPGLGEWDVRALVGHTLRAVTTVPTYLSEPRPDAVVCSGPGEYFALSRGIPGADDAAVAARGHEAGRRLGPDPLATVRAEIGRAREALAAIGSEDPVLPTVVGAMRLSDYLPTRTFELTAHSLDISRATGLPLQPPTAVLRTAVDTATSALLHTSDGVALFRHLIGRGSTFRPLFG